MDPALLMALLGGSGGLGSFSNFGTPNIPSMIGNRPIGQPFGYAMPPQLAAKAMTPGIPPQMAAPAALPNTAPSAASLQSNPFLSALLSQRGRSLLGLMG